MFMDVEGHFDAVADIAIIAVADLHFHIAHHRTGNPGDDALQHVLIVEFAGGVISAHVEANDVQGPARRASEIPLGFTHIVGRERGLDESMWADPHHPPALFRRSLLGLRLSLRVHRPGVIPIDKFLRSLLAGDGKSRTATPCRIVALHPGVVGARGLTGIINGHRVALQVHTRPIVRDREILAEITQPSCRGVLN